jgi:preprotein translocase subunit YajC
MEQIMDFLITQAHAEGASGLGSDFSIMSFLPFILIIAIMYFLIIRPQSKRAKEHKAMIEAIKRGDKIITAGGFIGTVSKIVDQNEILVELAPNIEVRMLKSSISQVLSKTGALAEEKPTTGRDAKATTPQSSVKKMIQKQSGKKTHKKP